jgi:hypothetical protein
VRDIKASVRSSSNSVRGLSVEHRAFELSRQLELPDHYALHDGPGAQPELLDDGRLEPDKEGWDHVDATRTRGVIQTPESERNV